MPQTSFALLTNLGRAKEAAALANATTIEITHIAIGDGATVPSGGEIALYNELARKTISGHGTVAGADNVAYFDCYLAAADGPYTIREAGLYDADGDMIAIAHYDPPINKPVPSSGQTVEGTVRLEVAFSNIATVVIVVDPSIQVALQRLTRLPWIPINALHQNDPPASPAVGDAYVIGPAPTGSWAGNAGKVAEFTIAGWAMITSPAGHGVSTPDGKVYEKVSASYIEKLALDSQSGKWSFAVAGGSANAIVANLTPAPAAYTPGMVVRLLAAYKNTAAVTVNYNSIGACALRNRDGSALADGALLPGAPFDMIYIGGSEWRLLSFAFGEVQRKLPFSTIYVRTDGNDANDGSANDAAHAFATINAALAAVAKQYILLGQAITVQLGNAGNYAGFKVEGIPGTITIRGNPANPLDFYISGSSSGGATSSVTASTVLIDGLVLNNTGGNGHTFNASSAANVNFKRTYFNSAGTPLAHISSDPGSSVVVDVGCKVYGTAGFFMLSQYGGRITQAPVAVEVVGTPNFSGAFACAADGGGISINPGASYVGAASGKRYQSDRGGSINTNGAGAGFFPGNVAGTAATGYYA
ncbi:MAG: phage tail protein [Pseudomonadota bacterium]